MIKRQALTSRLVSTSLLLVSLLAAGCVRSMATTPYAATPDVQPSQRPAARGAVSEPLDLIRMINDQQGWAIAGRSVLRTHDGGRTWSDVTPAGIDAPASTIPTPVPQGRTSIELKAAFLGPQAGWVAAPGLDRISIFHTDDAGQTWRTTELAVASAQQVYPIDVVSFTFLDDKVGWLLRSMDVSAAHEEVELYRTQNGGSSWQRIASAKQGATGEELGSISSLGQKTGVGFRDPANGWLTGFSAGEGVYLYRTTDGGSTWAPQELAVPAGYTASGGSAQSYPPSFFDEKKGLLPAYLGSSTPGFNLFFYVTSDGGADWSAGTPLSSQTNDFVWSWPDSVHGFVAEHGSGVLYSSSDGARSWSRRMLAGLKFSYLDFISASVGWAISDGGVLKTKDGGENWEALSPPPAK